VENFVIENICFCLQTEKWPKGIASFKKQKKTTKNNNKKTVIQELIRLHGKKLQTEYLSSDIAEKQVLDLSKICVVYYMKLYSGTMRLCA
jgi:hypothetical protein